MDKRERTAGQGGHHKRTALRSRQFGKKESYCVIPTGNALLSCVYPAWTVRVEKWGCVVRFHTGANGILA